MAGPIITHAAASGAGHGAGGLLNGTDWDATHTVAGLYSRQLLMAATGGGTTMTSVGNNYGSNSITTTGTAATFAGGGPQTQTRFTCAATTSSTASATVGLGTYIPPLNALRSSGVGVSGLVDFPDASYGSGSTGARMVFGCTRVLASILAADNGDQTSNNAQGIWFSYSSNRGANWFLVIYSTVGSATTVDTGVAFTPGVWSFTLDFSETAASFNWTIRNIGGSSASGTVLNSANPFPVNKATTYVLAAGLMTLSGVARVIGITRMGIDLLEPA